MTTKQIATKVLNLALQNDGYRIDTRWLARHLGITADQLNAALDFLGKKIIRVRGVGGHITAA